MMDQVTSRRLNACATFHIAGYQMPFFTEEIEPRILAHKQFPPALLFRDGRFNFTKIEDCGYRLFENLIQHSGRLMGYFPQCRISGSML
jgi:hypothetical protein